MTFKSLDGLGERTEEFHRREESRLFHRHLLSPLGMRNESEIMPQKEV